MQLAELVDEYDFFIRQSNEIIKTIFQNMPCHSFLLSQLRLNYNSTPNEVHRKLKSLSSEDIHLLRNNVSCCTCTSDDHYRSHPADVCMKDQIKVLLENYLEWKQRKATANR